MPEVLSDTERGATRGESSSGDMRTTRLGFANKARPNERRRSHRSQHMFEPGTDTWHFKRDYVFYIVFVGSIPYHGIM